MTARHKRRLAGVLFVLLGASIASALALSAFQDNLMFFYGPSEIAAGDAPVGGLIRLGGLVEDGSFVESGDSLVVRFRVTDTVNSVAVEYTGMLPDLFREGQGVVTHGRLDADGIFRAEQVLARHDENYMSPEVAASLDAAGYSGTSDQPGR